MIVGSVECLPRHGHRLRSDTGAFRRAIGRRSARGGMDAADGRQCACAWAGRGSQREPRPPFSSLMRNRPEPFASAGENLCRGGSHSLPLSRRGVSAAKVCACRTAPNQVNKRGGRSIRIQGLFPSLGSAQGESVPHEAGMAGEASWTGSCSLPASSGVILEALTVSRTVLWIWLETR